MILPQRCGRILNKHNMEKKLQRDENKKVLAGVAAGLGEYFDMDVTWVRIIFVLMAVFGFSGVLIYIILWIVVPAKPFFESYGNNYEPNYQRGSGTDYKRPPEFDFPPLKKEGKGRYIAGIILIALGGYFMLREFDYIPYWFSMQKLWPVVLIVVGVLILGNSRKKNTFSGADSTAEKSKGFETNDKDQPGDQPLA
ncbi:hypothetical protein DDR33_23960 [Pararcticibacter amylolyticus]|uniref:Phage shock protein PspC N-terminal domain-containing protein n=2 Tax=Pararcticibacter amylolyticus TaxID=2173175 RepID=A0A2U2P9Q6_9SPHI|nr:hypothetical protein DDR33_23960 [Pararcticibacter amylolyticus]